MTEVSSTVGYSTHQTLLSLVVTALKNTVRLGTHVIIIDHTLNPSPNQQLSSCSLANLTRAQQVCQALAFPTC